MTRDREQVGLVDRIINIIMVTIIILCVVLYILISICF